MEEHEDYYLILGLAPGVQGGNVISVATIRKAYRTKALVCHPDKRPDDPLAAAEFQKLQKAYDVLSDEKARKAYDDLLNIRKCKLEREEQISSKRRKMMNDLKERERAFEAQQKEKAEEERASKRLQEEIARIRAMCSQKAFYGMFSEPDKEPTKDDFKKAAKDVGALDKEKMVKVSWLSTDSGGSEYSAVRLKCIFEQFGTVEDIVIRPKKACKHSSALVVMSSRLEVAAATKRPCGDISNPLLVVPLVVINSANGFSQQASSVAAGESTTRAEGSLGNIVGIGYHDYEDSILKKMRRKAEELKSSR